VIRSVPRVRLGAVLAVALLWGAPAARADILELKDGRVVDGHEMTKVDGGIEIAFEHGKILVPDDLVEDWWKPGSDGQYVPKTDLEREKFVKGLVPWQGKWISKDRLASLQSKADEARHKRLEELKARHEWRNHVTVETKHFTFLHTLPDDLFIPFRDQFETYYEVFSKEWHVQMPPKGPKPTVNIYHDERTFHEVSGAPNGVLGYYAPFANDLNFYYDRERSGLTVDVMFHECTHLLTHLIDDRFFYPPWIREGIAEYYGASEWDPETKTMHVGGLQVGRMAALWATVEDDEKWKPLDEMIKQEQLGPIEYAWAWSFCHFCMESPKYGDGFRKYFVGLAKDKRIPRVPVMQGYLTVQPQAQIDALLRYLKVKSLDTLQEEWYAHIKETLAMKRATADIARAAQVFDAYGEAKKARRYYKKAIDAGCTEAAVYYRYAFLQNQEGRKDSALDLVQKAIAADPLHARARLLLGMLRYGDGDKAEGERLMALAAELDPDDTDIWLQTALATGALDPK
jgi:tetratricopeptide (TPR) repeat protein